jgi:hypothetical protein
MKKISWIVFIILLRIYWPLQKIQNFFFSFMKDKNHTKIFCIGSPKTGTASIHKALKILGFRSPRLFTWSTFFKYGDKKYIEKIKKCNYNAFVDYPFGYKDFYKKIDITFPGSKFILTVRNPDALEKSFYNFYKNSPGSNSILKDLPEKIKFIGERNDKIISYFKNRKSQLLVMDITKDDGWDKLCKFLDKNVPNRPFPNKNIGSYKK